MLRWPHGGHGDCASARTGYGVRQWARPAGTRVGGRFTALQRHQRCCRFEALALYCGAILEGAPSVRRKRESRKRKFSKRMQSPTHWGGRSMPGDHAPTQGGALGAVWGVLLRNYGFTDLPPSLPLPHAPTRSRASANQDTAGYELSEAYGAASHALDRHGICRSGTPSSSAPPHFALTKTFSRLFRRAWANLSRDSKLKITKDLLTHDSRSQSNS